ncbi:unnamed protein product [Chrysoparadoxa australica]
MGILPRQPRQPLLQTQEEDDDDFITPESPPARRKSGSTRVFHESVPPFELHPNGGCATRGLRRLEAWRMQHLRGYKLFVIFMVCNFLLYIDRGVIPGANKEFNAFIARTLNTQEPDLYLGLLQSTFVVGFSISSVACGHLVHSYSPFKIMALGLLLHCITVIMSGLSYNFNSYWMLLGARALSGVGEASFACVALPLITDSAPPQDRGTWVGMFLSTLPLGTACGMAFSSYMANTAGWPWTFFCVAMMVGPLALICALIPESSSRPATVSDYGVGGLERPRSRSRTASGPLAEGFAKGRPSLWEETRAVLGSPIFNCVAVYFACAAAVTSAMSTFGSEFMMSLGLIDSETAASSSFGGVVALSGIVGAPLGGILLDRADSSAALDEWRRLRLCLGQGLGMIVMMAAFAAMLPFFGQTLMSFLLFSFASCLPLFMASAALNMAVMLSVPRENRAFAVGSNTLLLHVLGDVPSPVLIGMLMDTLAPGCSTDIGSDDCRGQRQGIRFTILIMVLWIIPGILAIATAYRLQDNAVKQRRRNGMLGDLSLWHDHDDEKLQSPSKF